MQLATKAEVKAMLRIEHDEDDALIEMLLGDAHARMQGYLERDLEGEERTEYFDGMVTRFFVRHWPIDNDASLVITDTQGTAVVTDDEVVVAADEYRVDWEKGSIVKTTPHAYRSIWEPGRRRFKVVYTGGIEHDPDYETQIKPTLRRTIVQLVSMWYEKPIGVSDDREAMGVGRKFIEGIPKDITDVWDALKG